MEHLKDNNTLEALDKPKNKINASKLFNKIFVINPDDHINFLYKSRCENLLKKTTLIKNWSPIVEYSEK